MFNIAWNGKNQPKFIGKFKNNVKPVTFRHLPNKFFHTINSYIKHSDVSMSCSKFESDPVEVDFQPTLLKANTVAPVT